MEANDGKVAKLNRIFQQYMVNILSVNLDRIYIYIYIESKQGTEGTYYPSKTLRGKGGGITFLENVYI